MPSLFPLLAYRPETLAVGGAITILATGTPEPRCAGRTRRRVKIWLARGFGCDRTERSAVPTGRRAASSGRLIAAKIGISRRPTSNPGEDCVMRKCLLVVATCLAFGAATLAVPVQAQDTGTKTLTPQRQKMKDCAVKWKDEKAQKHVSGRAAYRAFMKECLKG
jgi:hypothetical protein